MIALFVSLLLAIQAGMPAYSQDCQQLSQSSGELIVRTLLFCPDVSDATALLHAADRWAGSSRRGGPLIDIYASASRLDLSRAAADPLPPADDGDGGFDERMARLAQISSKSISETDPLARVVDDGVSRRVTVRLAGDRSSKTSGITTLQLLGSADPQEINANLRWLWINESKHPMFAKSHRIEIYVKAIGPVSCDMCAVVNSFILSRNSRVNIVVARIRRDTWFDGPHFPLLYLFEPDTAIDRSLQTRLGGYLRTPNAMWYYRHSEEARCDSRFDGAKRSGACTMFTKKVGRIYE